MLTTEALWNMNNNQNDESGNGYTLLDVGAGGFFVTVPAPADGSSHQAAGFNLFNYWVAPAALRTAMNGQDTWTFESRIRSTSFGATSNPFSFFTSNPVFQTIQILTNGTVRIAGPGGFSDSATGIVPVNTNAYIALVGDAGTLHGYYGTTLPLTTPVVSRADTTLLASLVSINVGHFGHPLANLPMIGFLDAVRISIGAAVTFPSSDPSSAGAFDSHGRRGRR